MRNAKIAGFILVALLWSAILFGAGWMARSTTSLMSAAPPPATGGIPLLDEVWGHVQSGFVGEMPTDTVRNYGVVRGALGTLNDPYTVLVEPQPRTIERDSMRGQFGGIGVDIKQNEAGQIVISPRPESPALAAGVLAGDILVAVDGIPLPDKPNINDIAPRVRGEVGTPVKITVLRGDKRLDFSIVRAIIEVPSVAWRVITSTTSTDRVIGYIAINQFTERTGGEVKRAIRELRAAGSQAYLIDLRDNLGGLVSAAIEVASHFLDGGNVMLQRTRNQPDVAFPVTAQGADAVTSEPLAVLINGNSASASEIVAGAIQDHKRGVLIGEKSYGKGSMQSIYDLSDGSSAHITSARWLTPNGRTIDKQGLTPDVPVAREEGKDAQWDRAVQQLRK